jgi:uncharacterized protein (TIGR01777 family)
MSSEPISTSTSTTVAITGATGLIGSALATALRRGGHTVRRLVRAGSAMQPGDVPWDPERGTLDPRALEGCDAIVHLAAAPIGQRWTSAHKRDIRESRVLGTALVARAVAAMEQKPRVVLSASAMGYYGDRGDEQLDEQSKPGHDFLASVAVAWEQAAAPIADSGARLVYLRSGIVLSKAGGALAKMLPPFRLGVGGPMGTGKQWMSWITLDDQVRAMEHALRTESLRGPVNFATPNPIRNETFAETLGKVLGRPAIIPTPAFALKLLFGEMADTILTGQRLVPRALEQSGFTFTNPLLEPALRAVINSG